MNVVNQKLAGELKIVPAAKASAFADIEISPDTPIVFNTERGTRIIEKFSCHHGKLSFHYSGGVEPRVLEMIKSRPIDYHVVNIGDTQFCVLNNVSSLVESRPVYEFILDPNTSLEVKGKIAMAMAIGLIKIE